MTETLKDENEGTGGPSALSAGLGAMTHFWCEVCDAIQPAFFEGANHQDTSGDFVGGDVVCSVCAFIVATAYTPNGEVRGASRLAGEASSREAATSTVVLEGGVPKGEK